MAQQNGITQMGQIVRKEDKMRTGTFILCRLKQADLREPQDIHIA